MKKLLNQFGVSAVELILAMAMFAGIAAVTTKLVQNQKSTNSSALRNLDVEQTIKLFNDSLKRKASCNKLFAGKSVTELQSGTNTLNTKAIGIKVETSDENLVNFKGASVSFDGPTTGQAPATLELKFTKKDFSTGKERIIDITKQVSADLFVDASGNVECSGYNAANIEGESLEDICLMAGGSFASGNCIMDNVNDDLLEKIRHEVCEMIGGGNTLNGSGVSAKCRAIALIGKINSKNITQDKICLGSDCRVKFDNTACSSGYLRSLSVDGKTKSCATITAPAAGGPFVPPVTPPVTPPATCSKANYYSISGTNSSATTSKTCRLYDYKDSDSSCASTTSTLSSTAGICKKFMSGSCSNSSAGIVENFSDGTTCGTNKECQSGSCVATATPPPKSSFCPDGSVEFDNKTTCEASGKYDCSFEMWIDKTMPRLCMDAMDGANCKPYYCRAEKKTVPKVDCVGSFVDQSPSCKSYAQLSGKCKYPAQPAKIATKGTSIFVITTQASGGGTACSNTAGEIEERSCYGCGSRGR